jgi:hypothetical protein
MADVKPEVAHESQVSGAPVKRGFVARGVAHFKKWWWVHLIILICTVLIIIFPL